MIEAALIWFFGPTLFWCVVVIVALVAIIVAAEATR